MWMLALALWGCSGPSDSDTDPTVTSALGRLKIEELYYAGSPGVDDGHYFSDQFIELINDSDEVVGIGGLYLGDVHGLAGEINGGMTPDGYAEDSGFVTLDNVWRIPGIPEDHPLLPGESVVIAHDGTNHSPFSAVDLSGADYESWVDSGNDDDWPTVDNLEEVHFTGGYDWLITVFGPSVVVLELDDPSELVAFEDGMWSMQRAPVSAVVDAVETLMDGDSGDYKRLPASVDAGFVHVSGTYVSESVRRRRVGEQGRPGWLADTDDSTADFEISTPSPFQ